jgi:hypothetical protein
MRLRPAVAIGVVMLVAGVTASAPIWAKPALSRWVWTQLSTRLEHTFDARLEVESFDVQLLPSVRVEGKGLRLYQRQRPDAPAMVALGTFTAETTLRALWRGRLKRVAVAGLDLSIPKGGRRPRSTPAAATPGDTPRALPVNARDLVVDEIVSTGARLVVVPDNPQGTPLEFGVEDVRLTNFSSRAPAQFSARLLNPKPRGMIVATGQFGPWQVEDPRQTAVEGTYTLEKADMSVFRGIGGTLDSNGTFHGALADIEVHGHASMPDFTVDTGGTPMPFKTSFYARVNGTNGNTYLNRVSATIGGSQLEAAGEIVGRPNGPGRRIRLEVKSDAARLEDFIRLVVPERQAPMLGQLVLQTRMDLPLGDQPVIEALLLDGRFTITRGQFAADSIQDKVDELSRRGRGQPKNQEIDNVLSTFSGRFALGKGVLTLPQFQFAVRGAEVRLAGRYGLRDTRLGFTGELRLQATVSQTQTGIKSLLLKIVDPFFRKHGAGAVLPIHVSGTVASPEFGLRLFGKGKSDQ